MSTPQTIFVTPAREGLLVGFSPPRSAPKHLRPEGETVPDSTYWRRRERRGDVVVTSSAPKAAPRARATAEKG